MAWKIEFENDALKDLKKIVAIDQRRITNYLKNRILSSSNPRSLGKPLKGALNSLWRYRIGNYRIVCSIEDHNLIVLVIKIGHRKNIYE